MKTEQQIKQMLVEGVYPFELSDYARFTIETRGYKFKTLNGRDIYKWELFDAGYTNANLLIEGYYPIIVYKYEA